MSLPEVMLWQHPVGEYIADFYCSSARLVVEVDGQTHAIAERRQRDGLRDYFMQENGYRVIRIGAEDVLRDVGAVAASIVALAAAPLHHSPSASGPPPRAGEV